MTSSSARTAHAARENWGRRPKRVVFLADESVGILRESDQPEVPGLLGFDPDPLHAELWEEFGARGVSVELLLPEGTDEASLAAVSADISERIRVRARSDGKNCYGPNASTRSETVVVSADRIHRGKALEAGAAAVPHGMIARQLVEGEEPVFVAIRGDEAVPRAFGTILILSRGTSRRRQLALVRSALRTASRRRGRLRRGYHKDPHRPSARGSGSGTTRSASGARDTGRTRTAPNPLRQGRARTDRPVR